MDDFSSDISTLGQLPASGFVTGNIETAGDSDWFKITLVQGTKYRFYLSGSQGSVPVGTLADPILNLMDTAGTLIASNDNGYGQNAVLDFTAPTSGVYFLGAMAAQAGATGTYTLASRPFVSVDTIAAFLINGWWTGALPPNHWGHTQLTVNISALTPAEQNFALTALSRYQDISNLTFTTSSGTADIVFMDTGTKLATGHATSIVNGVAQKAMVDISSDFLTTSSDTYVLETYIHEIGHALGLGHSGPYDGGTVNMGINNIFANDSRQWSVMSYFGWLNNNLFSSVTTPQMADIDAIQQLYGANLAARVDNTVYGFHSTAGVAYDFALYPSGVSFTIYDAGGTDTLDASGYSNNQTLDLTPGAFSSLGGFKENVGIYLTTTVENAIGGSGADQIIGNAADNQIMPGKGNDTVDGGSGVDTVVYSGTRSQYTVTQGTSGTFTVTDSVGGRDGTDGLQNVEQLKFSDYTLVFDLTSSQDALVYRLYQAAFARTPDNGGFRFWANVADQNHTSATALADQFLAAPEFAAKYGTNPSDSAYAAAMYTNVLQRAPDQAGLDYWVNNLAHGEARAQLLVDFAMSIEMTNLIGAHTTGSYWTT